MVNYGYFPVMRQHTTNLNELYRNASGAYQKLWYASGALLKNICFFTGCDMVNNGEERRQYPFYFKNVLTF